MQGGVRVYITRVYSKQLSVYKQENVINFTFMSSSSSSTSSDELIQNLKIEIKTYNNKKNIILSSYFQDDVRHRIEFYINLFRKFDIEGKELHKLPSDQLTTSMDLPKIMDEHGK